MHKSLIFAGIAALLTACSSTPAVDDVSSYVQTGDGYLLHFHKIGQGNETLVVPGASWVSQDMQRLARDRTVIFYDPRGRGRSDLAYGNSLDMDLEDLEIIRRYFALERFSLLGVDYHGALAAHYAALNPDRIERLVIVSPVAIARYPYWDVYRRVFDDRTSRERFGQLNVMRSNQVDKHDPEAWAAAFTKAIYSGWVADQRSLQRVKSVPFVKPNISPERQISAYFQMMRQLGDWDWRSSLRRVSSPTLVIYGEADPMPVESSREWTSAIPGARALVMKCGRLPWIEQPGEFFSAVEPFLAGGR